MVAMQFPLWPCNQFNSSVNTHHQRESVKEALPAARRHSPWLLQPRKGTSDNSCDNWYGAALLKLSNEGNRFYCRSVGCSFFSREPGASGTAHTHIIPDREPKATTAQSSTPAQRTPHGCCSIESGSEGQWRRLAAATAAVSRDGFREPSLARVALCGRG